MLVTKWLITDIGGLAKMEAQNRSEGQAAVRRDRRQRRLLRRPRRSRHAAR